MSIKSKLTGVQIVLFQLLAVFQDFDNAFASYKPLFPSLKYDDAYFVERGRKTAKRERERLAKKIQYLKEAHYIEIKKEGEERLFRLTSKAKYEILRIQFILQMQEQKNKVWDRRWRLLFFDVPELKKQYRDFFRKLLRNNGFKMWQLSVWVTPYNPEPHLYNLLRYLGINDHYELVEVDCQQCSPRLLKKFEMS